MQGRKAARQKDRNSRQKVGRQELKEKGINAFVVKVTAAENAKPGLLNLHLADTTCSGSCASDRRKNAHGVREPPRQNCVSFLLRTGR